EDHGLSVPGHKWPRTPLQAACTRRRCPRMRSAGGELTGNPVRGISGMGEPTTKEARARAGRGLLVLIAARGRGDYLIAAKASTSTRVPLEAGLWVPSTVTLMVCAPVGRPLVDQTTCPVWSVGEYRSTVVTTAPSSVISAMPRSGPRLETRPIP